MLNFNIFYKKNENQNVFNYFNNTDKTNMIHKIQNYIPIYERFFDLNQTNWNTINLNHKYSINNIKKAKTSNIFDISIVSDSSKQEIHVESFFKFSPLIDPTKYMAGKYKETEQK